MNYIKGNYKIFFFIKLGYRLILIEYILIKENK